MQVLEKTSKMESEGRGHARRERRGRCEREVRVRHVEQAPLRVAGPGEPDVRAWGNCAPCDASAGKPVKSK